MKRAALLVVLGTLLTACGGEDLGREAPPVAAKPLETEDYCRIAEGLEFLPVLDFEPAATTTAVCDVSDPDDKTRNCNWYPGKADEDHQCKSPRSVMFPPDDRVFPGAPIPDGLCGAPGNALHVTATRISACIPTGEESNGKIGWGANFQIDNLPRGAASTGGAACIGAEPGMDEPGFLKFDASCWEGVSFWARKSGASGGSSITITVADVWTSLIRINPETDKSYCSNAESTELKPVADSEKCDAPGAAISLTEDWTLYTLPFSSLKQKGYGVPTAIPSTTRRIDSGNLVSLAIVIAPGDWDFWLDDLAFFRSAP